MQATRPGRRLARTEPPRSGEPPVPSPVDATMASTSYSDSSSVGLPSLPAGRRLPLAFLAAGALAIAVYFTLPPTAQSVDYTAIGLATVMAMLVGARLRPESARLPWYLFAIGLLCEIGGDAAFTVYEV